MSEDDRAHINNRIDEETIVEWMALFKWFIHGGIRVLSILLGKIWNWIMRLMTVELKWTILRPHKLFLVISGQ